MDSADGSGVLYFKFDGFRIVIDIDGRKGSVECGAGNQILLPGDFVRGMGL